ncbi:MAG: SDR family oxidoreductase [Myxococcota bacterium]
MGIALVTGSASRIGQTVAVTLARAGFDVVVHARVHERRLSRTRRLIERTGRQCWAVTADLARPAGPGCLCEQVERLCGSLDVLVHNAGVFPRCEFAATSEALLTETMAVHVHTPHAVTRRLAPLLRRGAAPCVIHVTDGFTRRPYPNRAAYFASKSALRGLTSALVVELAPHIRVNAVAPGIIAAGQEKETAFMRRLRERVPARRLGTMRDVADAVVFLATRAPFITGHVLAVDGGRCIVE